jgi:hypothetical protein
VRLLRSPRRTLAVRLVGAGVAVLVVAWLAGVGWTAASNRGDLDRLHTEEQLDSRWQAVRCESISAFRWPFERDWDYRCETNSTPLARLWDDPTIVRTILVRVDGARITAIRDSRGKVHKLPPDVVLGWEG